MSLSNAPVGCIAFVGFGSDTDCDGTSFYCCGVFAADLESAWIALQEEFGGMTYEGISEVIPAGQCGDRVNVDALMARESQNGVWNEDKGEWESVTVPFRYQSLGASWNPWVYDDSIGIPALDSRYDD